MRTSSGCLKSTLISSLQIIAEKPPLQTRRDKLSLKYYYKLKRLLQHSTIKFITPDQDALNVSKISPSPFTIRILKKYTKFNLENEGVLTDFSNYRLEIKEPTWELATTRINLSLTDLLKEKTQNLAY